MDDIIYTSDYNASISAECNQGLNYYYGTNGVEKDLEKAYTIFRRLGDSGDLDACVQLGCMYFLGHHVPPSAAEARFWWEQAQDHDEALYGLGMIHHQGAIDEGIPQDSDKAIFYWEKASDMFNEAATAALYKYYKNRPSKEERIINVHNTTNIINNEELNQLKIEVEMLQETVNYEQSSMKQKLESMQLMLEGLKSQAPAASVSKSSEPSAQTTTQINNLTIQLQKQEKHFSAQIDKLNDLLEASEEGRLETLAQLERKEKSFDQQLNSLNDLLESAEEGRIETMNRLESQLREQDKKHQAEADSLREQIERLEKEKSEQASRFDALAALVEKLQKTQAEDKKAMQARLDMEIQNFNVKITAISQQQGNASPAKPASKDSEPQASSAQLLQFNLKLEQVQKEHQEEKEQIQSKLDALAVLVQKLTEKLAANSAQAAKTELVAKQVAEQLTLVQDMGSCKISHEHMKFLEDRSDPKSYAASRQTSSMNLDVNSGSGSTDVSPAVTSRSPNRLNRQQTRLNVGLQSKKRAKKNLKAYMDLMIKVRKRMSKKGGKEKSDKEILLDVFKTFDADGSGFLDSTEIKNGLATCGVILPLKEVEELMLEVDEDGSGELDYKELVDYLTNEDINRVQVVEEIEPPKEEASRELKGAVNVITAASKFKRILKR